MKFPNRVFANLLLVGIGGLLLLQGSSAGMKSFPRSTAEPVDGLQMTLSLRDGTPGRSQAPWCKVELRNTGKDDLVLNLGMMLANGRKQYPNAVTLTLTDAQGKSRHLKLNEPFLVAGRVDPLVVTLPVGAIFSFPADLDRYWPPILKDRHEELGPGDYSLVAQFTGAGVTQGEANLDVKGLALMPFWKGTVTSNELTFTMPSR